MPNLAPQRGGELEKLVSMMEEYETVHYPIDPPSKEFEFARRMTQCG
ncbi:MAG: hypothetical protein IBX64_12240 [Actinobacteria bacterium]|nr:hypothetical protein [Actinomycetota bacterium]